MDDKTIQMFVDEAWQISLEAAETRENNAKTFAALINEGLTASEARDAMHMMGINVREPFEEFNIASYVDFPGKQKEKKPKKELPYFHGKRRF